jgi:phage gpG-like protein
MYLSFEIEGEKQVSRNLRNISEDMGDWTDTFKKVGAQLTSLFSGPVFDTQGAEIGETWAPRTKDYPWPILQKTGTMRRSFEYEADKDYVVIHNTAPYFVFHQSNQPRHKLPRRVMMKIDEKRKMDIVHTFNYDLVYRLNKRLS